MPKSRAARRGAVTLAATCAAALAVVLGTSAGAAGAPAPTAPSFPRSLVAWGDDSLGQLGDGMTGTRALAPVTVQLPLGTKVASFRSGCDSSVVLTAAGRVLDFGSNSFGQLGDGKKADSAVPAQARFPAGTKVTAVRAGCDFNLALTAAGRVFAWGRNPAENMPAVAGGGAARPARVRFPAGTKITAISAGGLLALALTAKGRVYAWGNNDFGQLGNGSTRTSRTPVRVRLPGGATVRAVAAGGDFGLALTSTGRVLSWGANHHGQLGNGSKQRFSKAIVRVRLPGGTKVRSLFAGDEHALALTSAGTVLAWGSNFAGQLGDGTTTERKVPVAVKFQAGTKITAISAGSDFSLAVDSAAETVLAWGEGSAGQLGDGKGLNSPLPVQVGLHFGAAPLSIGSGPAANSSLALVEQRN